MRIRKRNCRSRGTEAPDVSERNPERAMSEKLPEPRSGGCQSLLMRVFTYLASRRAMPECPQWVERGHSGVELLRG